jgi:hypothetical protein
MLNGRVVSLAPALVSALFGLWPAVARADGPAGASPRIEIVDLPAPEVPQGLPAIPWVGPQDASWQQGPATFELGPESGIDAKGWLAVSNDSILLRVVVTDAEHVNTRAGADIWNGDSLQVGIDARGDSRPQVLRQAQARPR